MNAPTSRDYLHQKIKTASPAQLHLMLIEGGLRCAQQADKAFESNQEAAASIPLRKAMDIVSELLAGVKHSVDEVNVKLATLYQFIFTRLTMAYVNTDRAKLLEAIRILEFERDTWRQACEKIGAGEESADRNPAPAAKGPHKPVSLPVTDANLTGGLSLEA